MKLLQTIINAPLARVPSDHHCHHHLHPSFYMHCLCTEHCGNGFACDHVNCYCPCHYTLSPAPISHPTFLHHTKWDSVTFVSISTNGCFIAYHSAVPCHRLKMRSPVAAHSVFEPQTMHDSVGCPRWKTFMFRELCAAFKEPPSHTSNIPPSCRVVTTYPTKVRLLLIINQPFSEGLIG